MTQRGGLLARWRGRPAPAPTTEAEPERRRGVRHTTVLQLAKLLTGERDELCVVRDIWSGGLKAEVYCDLAIGAAIGIELRTGYRADGRITWAEGGMIGMEFDRDVSVLSLLTHCSLDDRIGTTRPPRLDVRLPAIVTLETEEIAVELCDVSLAGMKVRIAQALPPDARCRIAPDGMAPLPAQIRWQRDGHAGIQLLDPLGFAEFGAWRRTLATPATA